MGISRKSKIRLSELLDNFISQNSKNFRRSRASLTTKNYILDPRSRIQDISERAFREVSKP
jgi:hypothetical protein